MSESHFQKLLQREMTRKEFLGVLGLFFISLAGLEGFHRHFFSNAATLTGSIEPENGTVNSPASIITDSTASGGKAVQFEAATTPVTSSFQTGIYMGPMAYSSYHSLFGKYAAYESIYYQANSVTTPNVTGHKGEIDVGTSPVIDLDFKAGPFTLPEITAWGSSVQSYFSTFVAGLKTISDYATSKNNGTKVYFSFVHEGAVHINNAKFTYSGYNGVQPSFEDYYNAWNKVMTYIQATTPNIVRLYWYGGGERSNTESVIAAGLTPSLVQMATFDPYRWTSHSDTETPATTFGSSITTLKSRAFMKNSDGSLKPWGLTEWGTDASHGDANNAAFMTAAYPYLKQQGAAMAIYFDRVDGANNWVFTDDSQPQTLAAYKAAFVT